MEDLQRAQRATPYRASSRESRSNISVMACVNTGREVGPGLHRAYLRYVAAVIPVKLSADIDFKIVYLGCGSESKYFRSILRYLKLRSIKVPGRIFDLRLNIIRFLAIFRNMFFVNYV